MSGCDHGFGFGGGFAFIVVLFKLLYIVGASCFGVALTNAFLPPSMDMAVSAKKSMKKDHFFT